jgi:hypothetical protein
MNGIKNKIEDGPFTAYNKYLSSLPNVCLESDPNGSCSNQIISPNKQWMLRLTPDGNLELINLPSMPTPGEEPKIVWQSNTANRGQFPYKLVVQTDGNLVIYDKINSATWSSGTYGHGQGPFKLMVQDDGNVVLYEKNAQTNQDALWSAREGRRTGTKSFVHMNPTNNKCLASNGNEIDLRQCNGDLTNRWLYNYGKNTIQTMTSKKCLDSNGEMLYLHDCNNGEYQRWYHDGQQRIRHGKSGKCLDSNGTSLYINHCNDGDYQKWF